MDESWANNKCAAANEAGGCTALTISRNIENDGVCGHGQLHGGDALCEDEICHADAARHFQTVHRQGESGSARGCGVALRDAAEEGEGFEACL